MSTLQETQPDLDVLATTAAQDLSLIDHQGMQPTERHRRQLMLPEQATPDEVAAVMDGVLGVRDAEPAPQPRWQDFKDGKVEASADLPNHSTSLISYIGRQATRVFKRH